MDNYISCECTVTQRQAGICFYYFSQIITLKDLNIVNPYSTITIELGKIADCKINTY